jgi:hypothetical protein
MYHPYILNEQEKKMSDTQRKARNGDYKNTLAYPKQKDFQKVYVYARGNVIANGVPRNTIDDHQINAWKTTGHTVAIEDDTDALQAARRAYSAESGRLDGQFLSDLEEEHGMTGHPKAALLYGKAWQLGHSAGLGEVASYYEDLVDLVK